MGLELAGATPDERLKELTEKLEQGVSEIFTSGRYAEYLSAMSKFHTYSFGNVMLILMQNPAASCVAGFHTWKKEFGRNVKAHESGLKILAPCPYRRFIEQDKLDKDGKPVLDATGKPVRERTLVQLMRFVFDISQTEGKELPSIGVSELSGNIDRFEELANAITSVSPVPILYEAPHGAAKGCFNHVTEEILVRPGMSQKQTLKTMLHEISHATLHRRKKNEPPYKDQHTREVEAESVAYVVCQHFGIDTSDYSFGYVAGWSKGKELNELKASLDTIRSCAADLIDAIAEKCPISACQSPSPLRRSVLRPAIRVSISITSFGTPCVYKNCATQRTPLPHILPSEPSALNIRMVASPSAVSGGQMQIMPSAPMEKCRRESFWLQAAISAGRPVSRQSR